MCLDSQLGAEPAISREVTAYSHRPTLLAKLLTQSRRLTVGGMQTLGIDLGIETGGEGAAPVTAEEASLVEIASAEALTAEWPLETVAARARYQPGAHRPIPLAFHVSTQYGEHLVPLGSVRLDLRAALDALERAPSGGGVPVDFGGSMTAGASARPSCSFDEPRADDASGMIHIDQHLVWCGVVCGHVSGSLRFRGPISHQSSQRSESSTTHHPPPLPPNGILQRARTSMGLLFDTRMSADDGGPAPASPSYRPSEVSLTSAAAGVVHTKSGFSFRRRSPRPAGSVRFSQPECSTSNRDSRGPLAPLPATVDSPVAMPETPEMPMAARCKTWS